ncbi:MAG: uracil-DNA glycosylase [Proteobacteria bacterium]|nr:MAG: uracil-DNA glycosylase [Pseudomonadota bacterium]
MSGAVKLAPSWLNVIGHEFDQDYMQRLREFLIAEKAAGKTILPHSSLWFNALNSTPFDQVKVVILGQDPYPTPGHAHGLCFSAMPEVKPLPKSLININKELLDDLGVNNSHTAYLQPWAEQGVLLLNAVLTVQAGHSNSHQGKGWEQFTDAIVHALNERAESIVFILWGSYAQKKAAFIDAGKHYVIKSAHPSPLSAHRGFFGSKPFSKTNAYLEKMGKTPINWQL